MVSFIFYGMDGIHQWVDLLYGTGGVFQVFDISYGTGGCFRWVDRALTVLDEGCVGI